MPEKQKDLSQINDHDPFFRDRLKVFLKDVADGFYETDLKGNFRFFNDALCRIFGYPADEIQGENYRTFMDAKNTEYAYEIFNTLYETGSVPPEIIWRIIRKDGKERILEISASLIVDSDGNKSGFQGVARDVTEKILYQDALKASEACSLELYQSSARAEKRYRAFLEFLPDPVFVFNMDSTVSYLNPAFEKVFGWTLKEYKGKRIPFVPDDEKEKTRKGIETLFRDKVLNNFETRRLTIDGRALDIIVDGSIFFDEKNRPAGQVITLRDITAEKRAEQTNTTLFRIASALHQFRRLSSLLDYITRQVQELIQVAGASIILMDENKDEFFIPVAAYEDKATGKKMKEIRFPVGEGVAGYVYRTGKPLIVPDTSKSPYFFGQVDKQAQYHHKNMLDVPMRIQDRTIGVLCAVNKKEGGFDDKDVDLLSAVASLVALPIEKARINQKLKRSYDKVRDLNRAKDQVIHHLSHELKTPVSVLSASLGLLSKRFSLDKERAMGRALRSLNRLLEMQYEIEDMLRGRDFRSHWMMSRLLDSCRDALESIAEANFHETDVAGVIQEKIDHDFGSGKSICKKIALEDYTKSILNKIKNHFFHRDLDIEENLDRVSRILLPPDVLEKVVTGLVRNAVENTPDKGRIEISVYETADGPVFQVKDYGVGITPEKQQLIFNSYFATGDTMSYSSKAPYDFNAGGKGFDLLRVTIFSERYGFKTKMVSERCGFIPKDSDRCPGDIAKCGFCSGRKDCHESGGTTMKIFFTKQTTSATACRHDET